MQNLTISLSESMKEFIQEELSSGAGNSPTEVIEKLILEEKKRRAREKIEALLDKAIASGEPTDVTPQDWEDIRKELQLRQERRNGKVS